MPAGPVTYLFSYWCLTKLETREISSGATEHGNQDPSPFIAGFVYKVAKLLPGEISHDLTKNDNMSPVWFVALKPD